jgi:hypothetical protein
VLFAVAVGDRAYGYSVPGDVGISDADLRERMTRQVEPLLAAGDWAGAAVAVADSLGRGAGGAGGDRRAAAGSDRGAVPAGRLGTRGGR